MTAAIVTLDHCRRLNYCARGMRSFFANHGLDWTTFIDRGLPAETIEATGDAMALRVVELARAEAEGLNDGR
jgi:hypothetical protein